MNKLVNDAYCYRCGDNLPEMVNAWRYLTLKVNDHLATLVVCGECWIEIVIERKPFETDTIADDFEMKVEIKNEKPKSFFRKLLEVIRDV